MTNIDKIVKTIKSCKTIGHINTCIKWINDLTAKKIIEENDHSILVLMCSIRALRIQYD